LARLNADLLDLQFVRAALGVSASGLKNLCIKNPCDRHRWPAAGSTLPVI
jgi:hypothetical protein